MACSECGRLSALYSRVESEYIRSKERLERHKMNRLSSQSDKEEHQRRIKHVIKKSEELDEIRRQFGDHLRNIHR
jgi:hypothetical protein